MTTTIKLTKAQDEAMENFLDEGRVPVRKISGHVSGPLLRMGLIAANNGHLALTPMGRDYLAAIEAKRNPGPEEQQREWLSELPPKYARLRWDLSFLKDQPRLWTVVREYKTREGARSARCRLRKQQQDGYEFEARSHRDGSVLYGRWVSPRNS